MAAHLTFGETHPHPEEIRRTMDAFALRDKVIQDYRCGCRFALEARPCFCFLRAGVVL